MHSRAVVVAIMVLFLVTGIMSSTACEMMCIPANQTAACCAHPIRHDTSAASITNAQQCGHPQEETALVVTAAQTMQPHTTMNLIPALASLPHHAAFAGSLDPSLPGSLKRSSFIPPLRI